MNVTLVVDALGPRLSGIGRYVWELCRRVPPNPSVDRIDYFANGRFIADLQPLLNGKRSVRRFRIPRSLRSFVSRRRLRSSLVHGPNYFLPPECETGVVTIHDLSVFRYPETHPAERIRDFERQFERSLSRAQHVITDCETVRGEVLAHFGLEGERVTAIALGVGDEFHPRSAAELEPELAGFRLSPGRYALSVSTLEPRKKIGQLIAAWRELPEPLRSSTPLVLAGAKGWLNDQLYDAIGEGVAAGWLKHLGFVSEQALPALSAGASLFLYPSIYEGFGLPPIEAMASGVPVIVSNRSCLPEVCGDAAAYVDPDDLEAFTGAIGRAINDLEWRALARARGLERAARFSWQACASQTVEVYRRCRP